MSDYIQEDEIIWSNAAKTARVRVARDAWPVEPVDNDCSMATFRVDWNKWDGSSIELIRGGYGLSAHDYDMDGVTGGRFIEAWSQFNQRYRLHQTLDVFQRYVRIFHGSSTQYAWNYGIDREYGYIVFDTAAWRKRMGTPEDVELDAAQDFQDYASWIMGDCYTLLMEHKHEVARVSMDLVTRENEGTTEYEWHVADSISGLYGDSMEDALELALNSFIEIDEDLGHTV